MAEVRDQEDLSSFVLSAFGDEIDDDVDTQLDVLGELDIRYLEMRTAWGKSAADLNDREIERLGDGLPEALHTGELHRQPYRQVACHRPV